MTAAERLEKNSMPVTECGCLIWLGGTTNGYGAIRTNWKFEYTHRLAWQLKNGPIPDGMYVCHRCDIRCCVNPDHLFIGTYLDNIKDMISKGRNKSIAGFNRWKPQGAR